MFDIEVNEKDPDKFIEAVKAIAPTFGGINLEDIKAPECFEIERRLKEELDIPVMHDDQHGAAITIAAALLNAAEVADKELQSLKVVISGAGAAAISTAKMLVRLGLMREQITMTDSKGVITISRDILSPEKALFASSDTTLHTLADAVKASDVFIGLSVGNILTKEMVRSMADSPIIFALANPTPEISYTDAMAARPDAIMATGRTDTPNQINNALAFPYLFRGALDTLATNINHEMEMAAVKAIAALSHEPVPDDIKKSYGSDLNFGPAYILPKLGDHRLLYAVSKAVAKAAMDSGIARRGIASWSEYDEALCCRIERETHYRHHCRCNKEQQLHRRYNRSMNKL